VKRERIGEKKKLNSRLGEIEISKSHPWSQELHDIQASPYLQELQAYAGQNDNYEAAAEYLQKYLRIPINSSQVKRVTKVYAQALTQSPYHTENELQSAQESKVVAMKAELKANEVVYGMVDGTMLQTRQGDQNNDWKEVKMGRLFRAGAVYELDKHHNWIKDSVYCGHLGSYEAFLEKFEPLTDLLDDLQERFVFIADGATWIWRWVSQNYPKATQILDFYHAVEHLSDFARLHFKDKQQRDKWISKKKIELLNDKIESIIIQIQDLKTTKSVDQARNKLLTYLKNNQHRMRYKTFREKGLSIGSGAIESAHRTVIQKRMKQSGQRWSMLGAQNVIDLRLLNVNQQWSVITKLIKQEEKSKFDLAA